METVISEVQTTSQKQVAHSDGSTSIRSLIKRCIDTSGVVFWQLFPIIRFDSSAGQTEKVRPTSSTELKEKFGSLSLAKTNQDNLRIKENKTGNIYEKIFCPTPNTNLIFPAGRSPPEGAEGAERPHAGRKSGSSQQQLPPPPPVLVLSSRGPSAACVFDQSRSTGGDWSRSIDGGRSCCIDGDRSHSIDGGRSCCIDGDQSRSIE